MAYIGDYANFQGTGRVGPRNEGQRPEAAAVRSESGTSPLALLIPSLKGIPDGFTVGNERDAYYGRVGMAALRAGVIQETDLVEGLDPVSILESAIKCRVEEAGARAMRVSVTVDLEQPPVSFDGQDVDLESIFVSIDPAQQVTTVLLLRPFLSELECEWPGFGTALLTALSWSISTTIGAHLPEDSLLWAQRKYWGGCEDEAEFYETWGENPEDYPDMITRAQMDAEFPTWMTELCGKEEASETLLYAMRRGGEHAELASLALTIITLASSAPPFESIYFERGTIPYLIRASRFDPSIELFDDRMNDAVESGEYADFSAIWSIDDDASNMGVWLEQIKHYFRIARLGEKLLNLLTELDHGFYES